MSPAPAADASAAPAPPPAGTPGGSDAPRPAEPAAAAAGPQEALADLYGLSFDEMRALAVGLGEPAYRGNQLFEWVWRHRAPSLEAMTSLPKRFRDRLHERARLAAPRIAHAAASTDGTRKLVLELDDGKVIECVLIPDGDRLTLCVSTQVGCALACAFCATGTMGFHRNLTAGEILGQVVAADRVALEGGFAPPAKGRTPITNLVLMGMGEPLLNPRAVAKALAIAADRRGLDFSPQRVTLSTVGIRTNLWSFLEETGANLAISLHAADPALRARLMPIEETHPLDQLLEDVRDHWRNRPHDRVTFEYVLLDGVNDSREEAIRLAEKLRGIPCKVNLLAFNPHEGAPFQRPSDERVDRFRLALVERGVDAYVRRSRGRDIAAACGQLAVKPGEGAAPGARLRPLPVVGA